MYPVSRAPWLPTQLIYRSIPEWQHLARIGLLSPDAPLYDPVLRTWRQAQEYPQLRPFFPAPPKPIDWVGLLGIGLAIGLIYALYKTATDTGMRNLAWDELKRAIFRRDNYTCTYCGHRGNAQTLHVDHIVPLSRGGADDPSNLTTACWLCNLQKGTRTGWEYQLWRLFHTS